MGPLHHPDLFESVPNAPTPEELQPALAEWVQAVKQMSGSYQQDRETGHMSEPERDEYNQIVNPTLMRITQGALTAATIYDDADHMLPHILSAAHIVQLIDFRLEHLPRRTESTEAAYLRLQEAAANLIRTYEEIAVRMTGKIE